MDLFSPDQVLESKMAAVVGGSSAPDIVDELAASTPTPGGGSAAAYAGAMAAGLVSMVAKLTIGKKGYEKVEKDLGKILEESETLRSELKVLVKTDAEAFNQVMAAYKKSKSDPDRDAAIQDATLQATRIPLDTAHKALRVADLALVAAKIGNINAITDVGTAVNLAAAAVNSAAYNVRINLGSLSDPKQGNEILEEIVGIEAGAVKAMDKIKALLMERSELFS
jgi:glutamate formiminotransferase/formiminotetrahydrofolate cyclodeaminase